MRARLAVMALALAVPAAAQPSPSPEPSAAPGVIDVRGAQASAAAAGFDTLWTTYMRAVERSDADTAGKVLGEIQRLRIERNVPGLETLALASVVQGNELLEGGERGEAESAFARAVALDPRLPDGYFGLARANLKNVPLGIPAALKSMAQGMFARLSTVEGRHQLLDLVTVATLTALFLVTFVFALGLLARHGKLLVHDLEEKFGLGRGRPLAIGVFVGLALLPAVLFQGWGFLPYWWLALLFAYCTTVERVVAVVLTLSVLGTGPLMAQVEHRIRSAQAPLYRAGMLAIEGGPDARAMGLLEQAVRESPDDRDLVYLLGRLYKKAGRYDDASALYRDVLVRDPKDPIVLNNLGNIEFARGDFPLAIVRYRQAIDAGPSDAVAAALHYNLSLAQYQKFDYQPAQESRTQADRLAADVVRDYDETWKYEGGLSAPVDLGLTATELGAKFAAPGTVQPNVSGTAARATGPPLLASLTNRIAAIPPLFAVVVLLALRRRGRRGYTARCLKCGTAFCNRCHLGAASGSLCSQCHHLFVVRDGVSGPARNQKLLEVQKEEEQRDRVFRLLSLLLPGSGHVYAQKTLFGLGLILVWAVVLALVLVTGRVVSLTDAPSNVAAPWGLGLAAVVLLTVYVVANRSRPDYEVAVLAASPRRGAPGAAARRRAAS